MLTYEDLVKLGEDEQERIMFIQRVIREHTSSAEYRRALVNDDYYAGENTTIMHYEKLIYDYLGQAHVDMWTANHKIATSFFGFVVDQEVSYLLGNGVMFSKDTTKKRLGETFDQDVSDLLEYARRHGSSFGLWNQDHIDIFKLTEFAPLYSEETGHLMAGVRWWQIDGQKPLRATLYEPDGYTELARPVGEEMYIKTPKRAYKKRTTRTKADGVLSVDGENYDGFPIVPMYGNKEHTSAMSGKRNTIDAYDVVNSGMVNNVDEGSLIYWVLENSGGMDEIDDAKFIQALKTTRVLHTDQEGAKAEPKQLEPPFEGTKEALDRLNKQLFADFQAFDSAAVTASNQTATAIKASYVPLDLKIDKIEKQVTRFILAILKLAGIEDDAPTYKRNQIINVLEETQCLTMQAQYLPADYIMEKMLVLNGDIDRIEEIKKEVEAEKIAAIADADLGSNGQGNDDDGGGE